MAGLLVVALLLGLYAAYQAWRVQRDLAAAQDSASALRTAFESGNAASMRVAAADLARSAGDAMDRTDGPLWSAAVAMPVLGDDAEGVRTISRSLHLIATDGVQPLAESVDRFDTVTTDGRVDVELVRSLASPVAQAHDVFGEAARILSSLDTSGYAESLRSGAESYTEFVTATDRVLGSAETATALLPGIVGADGPRDYLLIFQNNAEIRATGGLPGSWAHVHAEDGVLTIERQGAGSDFGERGGPVLPLSEAEEALFGPQLGTYFLDANFTPDFPRAAELWAARWQEFWDVDFDGVMSIDPVGMSYLLEGIGSVEVPGGTLTAENVVEVLLSDAYSVLEPSEQDRYFNVVARTIFEAALGDLASPADFVRGFDRAAQESRFMMSSFVSEEADLLQGSRVAGELTGDDESTPYVDVTINDATGSKMSYYLRREAKIASAGCLRTVQRLSGVLELSQTIAGAEAKSLPDYVSGGGRYGTEPGRQLLLVRLFGPVDGEITNIRVASELLDDLVQTTEIDGRPAVTLAVEVAGPEIVEVEWEMRSGPGQSDDVAVTVTPSIIPGANTSMVDSSCD